MSEDSRPLKSSLAARQQEIALAHSRGASGFATAVARTAMMDDIIGTTYRSVSPGWTRQGSGNVAVLALGAYGRVELCPKSDVDIMVLCGGGEGKHDAEGLAKDFLHALWDTGLDVGHSVRASGEALSLYGTSVDAWASLVESRFVCGSAALAESFAGSLRDQIAARPDRWFIDGVLAGIDARHERYGTSVKLLEPNVKKSAGGLRDYHSLVWLFRATDPAWLIPVRSDRSLGEDFLWRLREQGIMDEEEYAGGFNALSFLLRVRSEMHYLRRSLHDTLEYVLQGDVAEGLGYGPKSDTRSVEVFMREYYLHARILHRLHVRLCQRFRELDSPSSTVVDRGQVFDGFQLHEGVLSSGNSPGLFSPLQVFEAFAVAAEQDAEISRQLKNSLEQSGARFGNGERTSGEMATRFKRILHTRNVAKTLHTMNELGILGKYIPEFGDLVAFFQHNVYHYFTADEHTLVAVAKAEGLRDRQGILHDVFRNLRRKDVLFLAILLHDIAKPRGVVDHEITGVEMARTILHRLDMDDLFADVSFLVRNHLMMEQVAFRRNVHDPETIKEFASLFERPEQLDYLYVLTYADLSAVNINVWTEWKATLLQELYQRTSGVLRRNLQGEEFDHYHRSLREASVQDVVNHLETSIPREDVQQHLAGIQNDSYLGSFTKEEIGQHIHRIRLEEPVSTMVSHQEGYTEVTVIARDAPFALSKFCAVLAANDANIFDATVFTRDDGIIIDRFRVSDAGTHRQLEDPVCQKITADLVNVVERKLDIEHLFQAHRRKWKRRPKRPDNPGIRRDVEFEDSAGYTIIDVYAPDALGLLYRITETISRLGLDIHFAKIATRLDGIVDAFYTTDRNSQPVIDADRREMIRREILKTITSMAEQELA